MRGGESNMEKEKSKILGVPLVLVAHAVLMTVLISIVMYILLTRMLTVPLSEMRNEIYNQQVQRVIPVMDPEVIPTVKPTDVLTPSVKKTQIRVASPSVTKAEKYGYTTKRYLWARRIYR